MQLLNEVKYVRQLLLFYYYRFIVRFPIGLDQDQLELHRPGVRFAKLELSGR